MSGGTSVQSMGEMWKDFCPNFLQSFLDNIDRKSCNDRSWELIPIFHNPHRTCLPSHSAAASTLDYLGGVPSKATSSGRKFGSVSKRPLNILMAVMRSSQSQSHRKLSVRITLRSYFFHLWCILSYTFPDRNDI